ncbi:MAG: 50S ribosomal protein L25 [Deltaproteobacteria bacterium]|nr:50S ribosomal protein L25 [Deltaproteobacteria bacterium]
MTLTLQSRDNTGKGFSRQLRQSGLIPGIIYGSGEPKAVSMRTDKTHRFIQSQDGTQQIMEIQLETNGKTEAKKVILQDYQLSNWGNRLLHVDFLEVSDETRVKLHVPIRTTENCIAVKLGGILQIIRHSIPISCKAKNLPECIMVDVENLQFGDSIHVMSLDYPEGVKPVVRGRNYTVITLTGKTKGKAEDEEVDGEAVVAEEEEKKE